MSDLDNTLKKIIKEVRGLHATDPRLQRADLITHAQYLKGLGFKLIEDEDLAFLLHEANMNVSIHDKEKSKRIMELRKQYEVR